MMLLAAVGMNAQSWAEPEIPTEGSEPTSGRVYRVKNVEEGLCLGYGTVWFGWNTTAMLVDPEAQDPLSFTLTEEFDAEGASLGWTFKNFDGPWPNQYVFVSGNGIEGFAMHVDNPTDVHRYFELLKQENGNYHIRVAAQVDTYGQSAVEDWESKCWGWGGYEDATGQNFAVYASVKPEDGFFCDWQFIDMTVYQAKLELYNLTITVDEEGLNVDYEQFAEAYNGNDIDALNAAVQSLKELISTARAYAILEFGEDGVNPPSRENPADATSLIVNNDFSLGNSNGWTCTFVSGTNATNVGYQGASYTNGDVQISQFIEAWAQNGTKFNENVNFSVIGDGELSQTMYSLPAGLYKFTVDCIAVQQYVGSENPVKGVQLFATGGELEEYKEIATGNGLPEHYEITFVSTGGDVKLGLRTVNATANWIAADNFTLTYYGEVNDDPEKIILDQHIADLDEKYGDMEDVRANSAVKENYQSVRDAAANATEDYATHTAALTEAAAALDASIADYVRLKSIYDKWDAKREYLDGTENFGEVASELADVLAPIEEGYNNGTYTAEDIDALEEEMSRIFAESIGKYVQPGDDLTFLLQNPGFEYDNSGWEVSNYDGTGSISAGNHRWGGQNIILPEGFIKEGGEEVMAQETLVSGCNEIWRGAFKYQQTIVNMPAGLYTLSCKGFQRNEDNQSDTSVPAAAAELFAITADGGIQTQKFANIFGDCSETMLYNGTSEGDYGVAYGGGVGTETDLNTAGPANGMYYPNGMCGASAHFAAGYYKQEFNFFLTEMSNVIVGARCQADYYWTLFDDFQIVYKGSGASVYAELIQKYIDQADAMPDQEDPETGNVLTQEALNNLEAAIENGNAVIDKGENATEEECRAAIAQLQAAIDAATTTMQLTSKLHNTWALYHDYRMDEIESSDVAFGALLDEIDACFNGEGFESDAEVEAYMQKIPEAFTKYVQFDHLTTATEEEPADITDVIYNPNGVSYTEVNESGNYVGVGAEGWDWDTSLSAPGYGADGGEAPDGERSFIEFYQATFDYHQTIRGLAPGYYVVGVQGFYRDGSVARIDSCMNHVEGYEERKVVELYANDAVTSLLPITADIQAYTDFVLNVDGGPTDKSALITVVGEEENQELYIPNMVSVASRAFYADVYHNYLQFEVKEGQNEVTIGIRKSDNQNVAADPENGIEAVAYGDWTMIDTWTLKYLGTNAPTQDQTTAIMGVETSAPVAAAIFNLAGQRVAKAQKGIYIINGKKVVIK